MSDTKRKAAQEAMLRKWPSLTIEMWLHERYGDCMEDRSAVELVAALEKVGFVIAPREPTEAMLDAGEASFFTTYTGTATSTPSDVWTAMVGAIQPLRTEPER